MRFNLGGPNKHQSVPLVKILLMVYQILILVKTSLSNLKKNSRVEISSQLKICIFWKKNEKMKHLDLSICFEIPMRLLLIPEEQLHKISAFNPSN